MNTPAANLDAKRLGVYGTDDVGNKTIAYTRILNHSIEKVWRAITDETHRQAWFPELALSHTTGGDAVVNFSGSECPPPESNPSDVYYCTVTRFEPPNLLEYVGPDEHHRFELSPHETGCLLKFSATLPDAQQFDDPGHTIQSRYSVACGWHYKLDEMEWSLDETPFEHEGYAGPVKTEYYFAYRKLDRKK
jgi:uncharacterized protein YndB with AHSA1/START domain